MLEHLGQQRTCSIISVSHLALIAAIIASALICQDYSPTFSDAARCYRHFGVSLTTFDARTNYAHMSQHILDMLHAASFKAEKASSSATLMLMQIQF